MKYHLIADGPPGYHVNSCKGTTRDMRDFIPSELNENKKNSSRNIFTSLQKKKKKKKAYTHKQTRIGARSYRVLSRKFTKSLAARYTRSLRGCAVVHGTTALNIFFLSFISYIVLF